MYDNDKVFLLRSIAVRYGYGSRYFQVTSKEEGCHGMDTFTLAFTTSA